MLPVTRESSSDHTSWPARGHRTLDKMEANGLAVFREAGEVFPLCPDGLDSAREALQAEDHAGVIEHY